jgi:hypothetical protein
MGLKDFNALVAEFLGAAKIARVRPRWRTARHPDYAEARMLVSVPDSRILVGLVTLAAHKVRLPPKYTFSVIFRGQRVLALDVNPGRIHKNLLTPGSVGGTHWQRWPTMDAEPGDRDQNFAAWLRDFLRAGNITTRFGVLSPPRGMQLRLINGDKGGIGR